MFFYICTIANLPHPKRPVLANIENILKEISGGVTNLRREEICNNMNNNNMCVYSLTFLANMATTKYSLINGITILSTSFQAIA